MRGFPFSCSIEVRYRDIDAMDHVNNAVYVTYIEIARSKLWREVTGPASSARDFPFIVARVAIDFRAPIGFGDDVEVGVAVSRLGQTSFTFVYRLEQAGRLVAEAESVQVLYDYALGLPVPIDGELRTRLEALAPGHGAA